MDTGIAALLGAAIGGLATIVVNWLNLRSQSKLTRLAQQEARLTTRQQYLVWIMNMLVEARAEYDQFLGQVSDVSLEEAKDSYGEKHAGIIGKAIAACLAVSDDELRRLANEVLTPYILSKEDDPDGYAKYKDYKNRNRNALHAAVDILAGQLVELT